MQPRDNPARVLLGLHGDSTQGFFLNNLYCLECILRTIWRLSWIFGIEKSTDIIYDHLDELLVPQSIGRDTKIFFLTAKMKVRNWSISLFFSQKMRYMVAVI